MLKKRQSKRISFRKKHNLEKKNKTRAKRQLKLKKKEIRGRIKLPKSVLLPDEDLELLKKIKEDEKLRANELQLKEDEGDFKRLVKENDLLLEILDSRDPLGSLNPLHQNYIKEKGKEVFLLLNNRGGVPEDKISFWNTHLKSIGYNVCGLNGLPSDKKIGIYGQRGVGKMFCFKQLNSPLIDKLLVRTEPSHPDFLSLLRNVTPLKTFFYFHVFNDFFNNINKDDFCMYFGVEYCDSIKKVEESFSKKFKIVPSKVFNFILEEFYRGKIKFWREGPDSKWITFK